MKYLNILLCLCILTACKSTPSAPNSDKEAENQRATETSEAPDNLEPLYCNEIIEDEEEALDTTAFRATHILNYKEVEKCACIKYEYSGCRESEAVLVWNGEWQESNRPEVSMTLVVRDPGLCDQLFTDSTCFSLKKMQLVGNEVLVYLNEEENNLLLDFNY